MPAVAGRLVWLLIKLSVNHPTLNVQNTKFCWYGRAYGNTKSTLWWKVRKNWKKMSVSQNYSSFNNFTQRATSNRFSNTILAKKLLKTDLYLKMFLKNKSFKREL